MGSPSEETEIGWIAVAGRFGGVVAAAAILWGVSFPGLNPAGQRLLAVTALMAIWWLTQAIPIAATSLVPLAAFPLLGIQSAKVVSQAYINDNVFLYLGGFVIALGIERWGLHRRMALHIVKLLGTSPRRIVLGFIVATGFLSMWISNTACTLLMLPIGLAMLSSLKEFAAATGELEPDDPAFRRFAVALMLAIAYSSTIGGMMTLVGTPTNIAFLQIWKALFPNAPEISAGQWIITWTPFGIVFLLVQWQVLVFRMPPLPGCERLERRFLQDQLTALGSASRGEWLMLLIFLTTALLWVFRTPLQLGPNLAVPGWGPHAQQLLGHWGIDGKQAKDWINDSTVAMTMALLMFCIPAERATGNKVRYLMDWSTAERLPWGVLLLFGGGFALAEAFRSTGLSEWVGREVTRTISGTSPWLLVAGLCLSITFLSELTSNVATVTTLLPILAGVALDLPMDPRLVMIPATIAASCGFMLPIATPPNAIVFGTGHVPVGQMMRSGFLLNLIGTILTTLATFWLLVPQQGIAPDRVPGWAARETP